VKSPFFCNDDIYCSFSFIIFNRKTFVFELKRLFFILKSGDNDFYKFTSLEISNLLGDKPKINFG
jgi:hypothetical protein